MLGFRLVCLVWVLGFSIQALAQTPTRPINGPLRLLASNPRYFTDNSGRGILLTGSHTWANFQEHTSDSYKGTFDWNGYLDMLQQHGHNFIRLWMFEQPKGQA